MTPMTVSTHVVKVPTTNARTSATLLLQVALDRKQAGKRLAELRESKRLTQWTLHERSGLSLRTVQRYENGAVVPRFDNLDALAKVLGNDVYDIFHEAPNGHQDAPDLMQMVRAIYDHLGLGAKQPDRAARRTPPPLGKPPTRQRKRRDK